jgi:hypothetical protein
MSTLADRIRSCDYLYLGALTEPSANAIRIVLLEAKAGLPIDADSLASESDPVLRSILVGSKKIEHFPGCRRFELVWKSYIAYSIVNESYSNGEPDTSIAVGNRREVMRALAPAFINGIESGGRSAAYDFFRAWRMSSTRFGYFRPARFALLRAAVFCFAERRVWPAFFGAGRFQGALRVDLLFALVIRSSGSSVRDSQDTFPAPIFGSAPADCVQKQGIVRTG